MVQDRSFNPDGSLSYPEAWQEHADGHTGALFAFCCRAGAHVAGCTPGELSAFGRCGTLMVSSSASR